MYLLIVCGVNTDVHEGQEIELQSCSSSRSCELMATCRHSSHMVLSWWQVGTSLLMRKWSSGSRSRHASHLRCLPRCDRGTSSDSVRKSGHSSMFRLVISRSLRSNCFTAYCFSAGRLRSSLESRSRRAARVSCFFSRCLKTPSILRRSGTLYWARSTPNIAFVVGDGTTGRKVDFGRALLAWLLRKS